VAGTQHKGKQPYHRKNSAGGEVLQNKTRKQTKETTMDRNVNGIRGGAEQAGVRQKTALQKKKMDKETGAQI